MEVRFQLIDDYCCDFYNYWEEICRISNVSFWNIFQLCGLNVYDLEDLCVYL